MKTIKNIGVVILNLLGVLFTIGFIWASIWLMCIASDTCYYNNFGGL